MDSSTVWQHIDRERTRVAALLESLPPPAWDTPSLCAGWTVRDVGAHLAFAQARLRDVLGPAVRTGFRYHAMIRHAAVHSPLTHEEIVATLRGFVGSRRKAPLVSDVEPLLDVMVHSQDICVPLGIDHPLPVDATVVVTDRALDLPGPLRWRLPPGVRLVATDADWARGAGEVVEAPIRTHLLTITGRLAAARGSAGGAPGHPR